MKRKLLMLLLVCLVTIFTLPAYACTEWSAAGSWVEGGGSILAKNRDWVPDHNQTLKLVTPEQGYRYFGIFLEKSQIAVKGGINECGLVVYNQAASSIPRKERDVMPYTKNLTHTILTQCKTVDDVIKIAPTFLGPMMLTIGDKTKTAYIEIGPENKTAIQENSNGVLYHTNHYIQENMLENNKKSGESSTIRYERIQQLLERTNLPFTINDFITMSEDQNDGPDNSIWRIGSSPKKARTLATFIVQLPTSGSPLLYIKVANPGQAPQYYHLRADDIFSGKTAY